MSNFILFCYVSRTYLSTIIYPALVIGLSYRISVGGLTDIYCVIGGLPLLQARTAENVFMRKSLKDKTIVVAKVT